MTGRAYITDGGYRVLSRSEHPLAGSDGRIYEHRMVLFGAIGAGDHACHWCKRNIAWKPRKGFTRLVADHLNDDRLDSRPENLVPSCVRCNSERARRPDFLTHCERGHAWTEANTYWRPDGGGRACRTCVRDYRPARRHPAEAISARLDDATGWWSERLTTRELAAIEVVQQGLARIAAEGKVRLRTLAPCGTEAAYKRHLYNKEPTDEACLAANAAAKRLGREVT